MPVKGKQEREKGGGERVLRALRVRRTEGGRCEGGGQTALTQSRAQQLAIYRNNNNMNMNIFMNMDMSIYDLDQTLVSILGGYTE